MENVAIMGASPNPDRYSYKALKKLQEKGHKVFLVGRYDSIDGEKVFQDLSEITQKIDTITLYVNPQVSSPLADKIKKLAPKRVIFNPGSENSELVNSLSKAGIDCLEACTLVLLSTNQF